MTTLTAAKARPSVRVDSRGNGSVRYLGSKARIVGDLLELIGPSRPGGRLIDAFAGTGVVGAGAIDRGWAVLANDHLLSSVCLSTARLISHSEAAFDALGGYERAVTRLNREQSAEGFFLREYSPASAVGRMYFTEPNAAKIDGIRHRIRDWRRRGLIGETEQSLLVADLIGACSRVANIAGTYGCFLNRWSSGAKQPLQLLPRPLRTTRADWSASCEDVTSLHVEADDVVYLDPPYTKRQYAAYYHVNETLAHGDEPKLLGKTGLRPWRDLASDFCYKSRALHALTSLVEQLGAGEIYLSYSSEGHVELSELQASLERFASVRVHELGSVGRYRPNAAASSNGQAVREVVLEIRKAVR